MAQPVFPPSFPPRPAAPPGRATASPPSPPGSQPQTVRQTSAAGSGEGSGDSSPSLEQIVRLAHDEGHSDVHLGVGETPRYRARGEMLRTEWPITDQDVFQNWLREILSPQQIDEFFREKEFDGSHAFPFVRIRINLLDSLRGPAMVLRLIPQTILTMEQLNLPDVLRELAARPKGLILVTGPTGSGKSTTLAAMIDWINRNETRHILTIEDPVEFVHESKNSLIRHREVGMHTLKFHNALRAALREDPDVILVGEIRDQETLSTALEAAQTGHLVFGTLHTNSAVKTVERVLGMFPPEEQESVRRSLSESLLGVIAQGLIRTTDGKRAAYHDILINTDACKDYIQRGALDEVEEIMERSSFDGMVTSNQSLQALVEAGRVEAENAVSASLKPNELAQALRGRS
ncbi:type IV pilus twitching motility protein PilT [Synechococcus sp. KORDI-100]|uniref:type IV pilus twitching motility protein PilT n=1 Tax=Synechococcus sp. KORDI-100 TaxID=1280380 RepID=UPI00057025D1|nr:type IV pilus twitching motility protein PilT [Synechococcus sp. KORDI-100]MED5384525.1 type IV pilus twitching motility protein PilT [Cyanobacteriota bacterium]